MRPSLGRLALFVGYVAASAEHSSSVVPVAGDAAASSIARGLRKKAAAVAVGPMEEKMRVLTKSELLRMTRLELLALLRQAASEMVAAPEYSPERENALANIRNIRLTLMRRALAPH